MSSVLQELSEVGRLFDQRRQEQVLRWEQHSSELDQLRQSLAQGQEGEAVRAQLRVLKRKALGPDEGKAKVMARGPESRVRMKAPQEFGPGPAPKAPSVEGAARPPMSRTVVQGSLQRQLALVDARLVELLLNEERREAGELSLLADLRAGLAALTKELPEHDLLLGLVADHLDQVDLVLNDLRAGGLQRALRFFEHDRELLGRLRAMSKVDPRDGQNGSLQVEQLAEQLEGLHKKLSRADEVEHTSRELEKALLHIHATLEERGFAGGRSFLFAALKAARV